MARSRKSKTAAARDHRADLDEIIAQCRVDPGELARLTDRDAAWAGDTAIPKSVRKKLAQEILTEDVSELAEAQELLYASNTWALLLIFQALDAAGKDSTIRHVMSGVNPQGCQVYSFKQPSHEELDHDFLWRTTKALPERGRIGIFNRSYYEEVLVVRVHPELLAAQRIPGAVAGDQLWQERFEAINRFEHYLTRNGTRIVKFFLHVSKEEQRDRFLERIERPDKHWKFSASDVHERQFWDDYRHAYEQMLTATSTKWAPWYVIPADHKWVTRSLVASIIVQTIESLDLKYPAPTAKQLEELKTAGEILRAETQAAKKPKK